MGPLATASSVALGGALGALARWAGSLAAVRWLGGAVWGTLFINLLGCLLIGVFRGAALRQPALAGWAPLLVSGFLGAFTTFSAFSWEAIELERRGGPRVAAVYVAVSVVGGLGLAWLGSRLAGGRL